MGGGVDGGVSELCGGVGGLVDWWAGWIGQIGLDLMGRVLGCTNTCMCTCTIDELRWDGMRLKSLADNALYLSIKKPPRCSTSAIYPAHHLANAGALQHLYFLRNPTRNKTCSCYTYVMQYYQ